MCHLHNPVQKHNSLQLDFWNNLWTFYDTSLKILKFSLNLEVGIIYSVSNKIFGKIKKHFSIKLMKCRICFGAVVVLSFSQIKPKKLCYGNEWPQKTFLQ